MTEKKTVPECPVTEERAREHALAALRTNWALNIRGFEQIGESPLDKEPLKIYDINGELLFYDYGVNQGNTVIGSVKASASKSLGTPVKQVVVTPRHWDAADAKIKAEKKIKKVFPKVKVTGTEIVCYSYPKIGVKVYFDDPAAGESSLVLDVASLNIIDAIGPDFRIGPQIWSYYDEAVWLAGDREVKRWDAMDKHLDKLKSEVSSLFREGKALKGKADVARELTNAYNTISGVTRAPVTTTTMHPAIEPIEPIKPDIVPIKLISQQIVQYSRRCKTSDSYALYAQMTDHHCAVASGQMLLDFYRYYYSQDEIGTSMNIGPGGCYINDIVDGLKVRSMKCLDVTLDSSSTWLEAKSEIDQNRPLMTLIPGHARTCFGWKRQNIYPINTPQPLWLYILDPWPWNADICKGGEISWEDWYGAYPHGPKTNYIYLRHRTSNCQ